METFLFPHDLLPTPGAVCSESKGGIFHSGFPFQAPVSVTASSRSFLLSLILPTSLSATLPQLFQLLHSADNNLQQRRKETPQLSSHGHYCRFFCSCVLRTASGQQADSSALLCTAGICSLSLVSLLCPQHTCPACPRVCGAVSPLLSAALLVLVCSFR